MRTQYEQLIVSARGREVQFGPDLAAKVAWPSDTATNLLAKETQSMMSSRRSGAGGNQGGRLQEDERD